MASYEKATSSYLNSEPRSYAEVYGPKTAPEAAHLHGPRFKIGQRFKTRGAHPRLCKVTDILKTYNANGDLVQIRYVAIHEFAGQTVVDRNVCETTIAMGAVPSNAEGR